MSIQKECADVLRKNYSSLTGKKLGAGHAHEIVAAFFGYSSGAALRAEVKYPLNTIYEAEILIPDLRLMQKRMQELYGLPEDLPGVEDLAMQISKYLIESGHFTGAVWRTWDLAEYINASYIQNDPSLIEDDLSGVMAATNAYFDELYVERVELGSDEDMLVANVSGDLNGTSDPDRPFHGDKIAFTTEMTFQRVAARIAYLNPSLKTAGKVDMSRYYPEEDDLAS